MLTREKLINRVFEVLRDGTSDDRDQVLLEVWKFLTKEERLFQDSHRREKRPRR